MSHRYAFLVLLLWFYFLFFSLTVKAQESTNQPFRVQTGLDLIYDDNVWQYSDSDRERFENNPDDPFFQKTNTLDDLIWEPYLYLNLQPSSRTPSTRLLTDLTGDFYTQNTALNFGTYRIGLEQGIGDKTHALITYTVTPRVFVGISRERRGGTEVGETVTTHATRFRIKREFRDLDLDLTTHYKYRNYNDAFDEQDSDNYGVGLESRIYSSYGLKTSAAYLFELSVAAGRNKPAFNNDLSYVSHQFRISPEVRLSRLLTIRIHYEIKYKTFTTNLTGDSNHYGRRDTTHTMGLKVYYEMSKNTEAKLGFDRVMRRTNNNTDFYSYDENIATVGLSYLF